MNIIPRPTNVELHEGAWETSADIQIYAPEQLAFAAIDVAAHLAKLSDNRYRVTRVPSPVEANVTYELCDPDPKQFPVEGSYCLQIRPEGIVIRSSSLCGVFYAAQSLKQLLATAGSELPCCDIYDQPCFSWRGMHLDVGRHFFDVDFVKRYLDLMAIHKLNVFHWHLTEDQGWRIEVDGYPDLVDVGAWRDEPGGRYGGFYTRDDVSDIVAYAAERFITVVPEIEMPGHARAALAAYPSLGCRGVKQPVPYEWGIFDDVFCAGNNQVFELLYDVLGEVMELFPGKYFHIGGDECPKTEWKACPKCQARIKSEGLLDEDHLQSWFITEISRFLRSANKKLIGWDEILEGGLAEGATVMSWRGTEGGIAAARQHHDVVMSPTTHCYFDYKQLNKEKEPGALGVSTLRNVYAFEPIPTDLESELQHYVLGGQGNVWTERMETSERVEFMVLPRMVALAETVWSPRDQREWRDFCKRLRMWMPRIGALGYNYRQLDDDLPD